MMYNLHGLDPMPESEKSLNFMPNTKILTGKIQVLVVDSLHSNDHISLHKTHD